MTTAHLSKSLSITIMLVKHGLSGRSYVLWDIPLKLLMLVPEAGAEAPKAVKPVDTVKPAILTV